MIEVIEKKGGEISTSVVSPLSLISFFMVSVSFSPSLSQKIKWKITKNKQFTTSKVPDPGRLKQAKSPIRTPNWQFSY